MSLREWIEGLSWYTPGSTELYSVSASKIGGDLLPIWLSKKYAAKKSSVIGLNYQGSAFHMGMEEKLGNDYSMEDYLVEVPLKRELSNGWIVTGTADVLNDLEETVYDYKTTSASGYKNMRKAAKDIMSQLSIQGTTLAWLRGYKDPKFYAEVFIRDFKPWRKDHPASAYQELPVDIFSMDQIEQYLINKTNKLQKFIDDDVAPPECKDVMFMMYEGERIKLKCQYYCDYSDHCPYFNSYSGSIQKTKLSIGGW